jgi:hypothetical protein
MKKLAAVVCALVLLFSASVSMADASEKEILFRGFPWGSSYTEFVEVLPESESRSLEGTIWGWAFDYRMLGIPPTDGCDDIGFYVKTGLPYGETVAGYSVKTIYASFVYPTGEDGILVREKENASLVEADYLIEIYGAEEQDKAYEDLAQKLTRLYGDVDYQSEGNSDQHSVWYGAGGTMVTLIDKSSHSGNTYTIELHYSSEGAKELREQAQAAYDYEFSLNTEGL